MLRRRLSAFVTAIALCMAGAAFVPASSMALDPILFVHGWNGSASNWNTMKARFEKDGYPASHLLAYSYNTSTSNKTTGEVEVKARVEQLLASTGATKVDILAHSMGSLNSRWYLKFVPGAQEKVDDWVSFGGPNHGTSAANICFSTTCVEMRIGSKFLTELNAGDETPGAVNYGTWWSTCDEFINPDESVILSGATNTNVGCVSHLGLVSDEAIYKQVREFVK
ncbi:MAG TPA: alpha/beta fold hydrolase [Solirubrobacterales bacterium]|nr:alpha/beta fold hydrolase [Solirubrobacterales bacterium]